MESWASAQSSYQNENFVNTGKKAPEKKRINISRSALFHMESRVSLKYMWKILGTKFQLKLTQESISSRKHNKRTSPLNSAYLD